MGKDFWYWSTSGRCFEIWYGSLTLLLELNPLLVSHSILERMLTREIGYRTSSSPSSVVASVNNIVLNIGVANSWYASILSQNSPLLTQLLSSVTGFKCIMGTLLSIVSWRKNIVSDFFKVYKHYQQCFPFWKMMFILNNFTHLRVVTYYSTCIMTHVLHWCCVDFAISFMTEFPMKVWTILIHVFFHLEHCDWLEPYKAWVYVVLFLPWSV